MPGFGAESAFKLVRRLGIDVPFIIVSSAVGEDEAAALLGAGADDFIEKGKYTRLGPAVRRSIAAAADRRRRATFGDEPRGMHDPTTGLPRRVILVDHLRQTILASRRGGDPAVLLVLDIDRFADVNDAVGHERGDDLLRQIGERLRRALREQDSVVRLEGDEFAVLAHLSDPGATATLASRILSALDPPFAIGDEALHLYISAGATVMPRDGEDPTLLLRRSTEALRRGRERGERLAFYDASVETAQADLREVDLLRHAIVDGAIVVHYQPIVDARAGQAYSAEALVRWAHPERGLLAPASFLRLVDELGLTRQLGLRVLRDSLEDCRAWREAGFDLRVTVNVPMQLAHDQTFAETVFQLLASLHLPPTCLVLEITESAAMVEPARVIEALGRLRDAGIRIAIDDFGTGYSSLAYLQQLPVTTLKVDGSFVRRMLENTGDEIIVRATIDLGHSLGLRVVGEQVEDEAIWGRLTSGSRPSSTGMRSRARPPTASLGLARGAGDRGAEAAALNDLASVALRKGDHDQARQHEEAALARFRAIGHEHGVALALDTLGAIALARGDRLERACPGIETPSTCSAGSRALPTSRIRSRASRSSQRRAETPPSR